jgi:hypothetical protein
MTFVDACTGFNQVVNTERAKRVLAVVARTGKFLPVCLTFGPTNGPDDFAYVVDRVYAPGRGRRLRLGKEWLAYVDDLTVRTGRQVDGVLVRDAEYPEHPIDHKIELCCFCILFYGLFLFLWSVFTDLNYGLFLLWLFVSWIEKNTQTLIKAFSDVNTVFSHTQVSILLDDKY